MVQLQTIQGLDVYVIELKKFPPRRPITAGDDVSLVPYAQALETALDNGLVTETGKYAIHVNPATMYWNIFKVNE